ncbi:MAG: hypothetical protein ACI9JN_001615 [Bacteroidia bacterium]|jgi:hypothetical protein
MLLTDEQRAKEFVLGINRERAYRLITAICARIERRIYKANTVSTSKNFDWGNIKKSAWETDLIFKLKMGLQLTDTYNTPEAARKRILQRRAIRNKARALNSFNS